jgi:diguanylate cyclase (GGDEF)-like protein
VVADVPAGERRETAGVTTRLIVAYVRARLGADGVDALLAGACDERPVAVLEDEATWSTYDQKVALFASAAALLDDPQVAQHIGRTVLQEQVGAPVKLLLRTLGSPGMVVRNIARAAAKFSTNTTMTATRVGRTSATVHYRLHDGYTPSRFDCDYNRGLLPAVTELFGLPPATIRHTACQVDGAPECVYEMEWRRRARLPWRSRRDSVAYLTDQLATVLDRNESLQTTMADLVSAQDIDTVLHAIATRAAEAVRAQRFVLAFVPREGAAMEVHHDGFDGDVAARRFAARMMDGTLADDGRVLTADVASARRSYGRLAALFDEPGWFFPEERRLLEVYARHAAVALDTATALQDARDRGATSEALLALARSLASPGSVTEVFERLADAVIAAIGAQQVTVMSWDPERAVLRTESSRGWPAAVTDALAQLEIGEDDSSSLAQMLLAPASRYFHRATLDDQGLAAIMDGFGTEEIVVVPIVVAGALAGVIAASRFPDDPPLPPADQLTARMSGIADHAALAIERARLLEHERAAVEQLRRDEAQIKHMAFHDPLTGLANGRLFNEHLAAAVARARRRSRPLAVLFCDHDRFTNVNDSLGHVVGNQLLVEMARRLRSCVRDSDVLARLGGDEFTVLLDDLSSPDDAAAVADKILDAVSRPFVVDGQELRASTSVGVAVFPGDGDDADSLLKNADTAMYAAKARRGAWQRYDPAMNARTRQLLLLESGLHGALERDELEVHYQPQVSVATGEIVAVEALVRWRHPTLGLVPPAEFIPLAEDAGLVFHIDSYVLHRACADAVSWAAMGLPPVRVGVNLSSRHVLQPGVVGLVAAALSSSGLPASRLELELTETASVQAAAVGPVLAELKSLGVALALDDFGTGHAVFRYLDSMPVDRAKLDRSFVAGLPDDRYDRAVTTALVGLAHELGLSVTAEGVETAEQAEFLIGLGCDELQGFLYGRPVSADALVGVLLEVVGRGAATVADAPDPASVVPS